MILSGDEWLAVSYRALKTVFQKITRGKCKIHIVHFSMAKRSGMAGVEGVWSAYPSRE
jgi:hypothetical protein